MSGSKQYFANVAEEWDKIRSGFFTEAMRDAAIKRAGLTAVDIDCAQGTCDCTAPGGDDIALSIFVAIGQKRA